MNQTPKDVMVRQNTYGSRTIRQALFVTKQRADKKWNKRQSRIITKKRKFFANRINRQVSGVLFVTAIIILCIFLFLRTI